MLSSLSLLRCSFDHAMQDLKNTATNTTDELAEVFREMRAHLYLYAGTLLLKRAQDGAQQWRAVLDLAALCYLVSYQVHVSSSSRARACDPPPYRVSSSSPSGSETQSQELQERAGIP